MSTSPAERGGQADSLPASGRLLVGEWRAALRLFRRESTIRNDAGASTDSGADLNGHLALTLLTATSADHSSLFVLSREQVVIVQGAAAHVAIARPAGTLPVPDRSFDLVVVRGDAVSGWRNTTRPCRAIISEIDRVLTRAGQCVISAVSTRCPPERRRWQGYGLRAPLDTWMRALHGGPLRLAKAVPLRYQGPRLAEMCLGPATAGEADWNARAMVLERHGAPRHTAIEEILCGVWRQAGAALPPAGAHRCLVRKIGKTAIVGELPDGVRFVARVPRTAVASKRAAVNHEAITSLHRVLPSLAASLVPRPLAAGDAQGYSYFVEQRLPGAVYGDTDAAAPRREHQALDFITELHALTARRMPLDARQYAQLVTGPLERIAAVCSGRQEVGGIEAFLRRGLLGRPVPFVWSHGDFALGNCLYHRTGDLSGVIDWELFSTSGLPLLDVVHRIDIPYESSGHPTWQRFDWMFELLRGGAWNHHGSIRQYTDRLCLDAELVPALLVMHWVDHVARRIDARQSDALWMQKRVHQPLSRLGAWLGAA